MVRGPRRRRMRSDRRRSQSWADTTHRLSRLASPAQSLWCMTSARAVNPERSKKFFAARAPGSAYRVDPHTPGADAERDDEVGDRLPHPHRARFGFDVQVTDHAEPGAVPEQLDLDGAEPHDRTVDRADDDVRVVAAEERRRASASCGSGRASRVVHERATALIVASPRGGHAASLTSSGRSFGLAARAGSTRSAIRRAVRSCRGSCGAAGLPSRIRARRRARPRSRPISRSTTCDADSAS